MLQLMASPPLPYPLDLPSTPLGLFIAVMMAVVGLLVYVVKNVIGAQTDINKTLNNHFTDERKQHHEDLTVLREISAHMATTNTALTQISTRLLDAVIQPRDNS